MGVNGVAGLLPILGEMPWMIYLLKQLQTLARLDIEHKYMSREADD